MRCKALGEDRVLQAINIREGGILLGNALGLEMNTALRLEFSTPEARKLISAEGRVIRKELSARIAVAFTEVSHDALEAIREFVVKRVAA